MSCFNELCEQLHITPSEREKLAWHLAMFRAKRTYEKLRAQTQSGRDDR